jgi:chromatin remodeling complex protein RSC6
MGSGEQRNSYGTRSITAPLLPNTQNRVDFSLGSQAKNALSKPVQPDATLAAVVGKDPLPRTELTKKLWEYIRKHELQDPKDKRSINYWRYSTARRLSRCSR